MDPLSVVPVLVLPWVCSSVGDRVKRRPEPLSGSRRRYTGGKRGSGLRRLVSLVS
jgi:hypothetical protein